MNEVITDWKGNEIKAGMTIYFVTTKVPFPYSGRISILMPQTRESIQESEEDWIKRKNTDIWSLGMPHTVEEKYGQLFYTTEPDEEGYTFSFPLYQRDNIAIKNISDKKE